MSRLASLTPSRHRSSLSPSPSPTPSPGPSERSAASTPSQRAVETTHHRMLKLVLAEVRTVINTWDDIVLVDGVKAGKGCIDAMTQMDNILQLPESEEREHFGPHLAGLHANQAAMASTSSKLDNLLAKLNMLIDQAEKIFFEAYRLQGLEFALVEPLWLTWTLERFVDSLPPLLTLHSNHFVLLELLASTITSPSTPFDDARIALDTWRDLGKGGERWEEVREWEELVELEMAGAGQDAEEEEDPPTPRSGRKKGRKG